MYTKAISGLGVSVTLFVLPVQAQTTYYVDGTCGDDSWSGLSSVCSAPDGPKATIGAGITAAADNDIVYVYRNVGGPGEGTYAEHITIDVTGLTLQGDTAGTRPTIGPTSGGNMVTISASGVTVKDFEISGKSGGPFAAGQGGREDGHAIYVSAPGTTTIEDCTVAFSKLSNILWNGDDGGGDDRIVIRNCNVHHADDPQADYPGGNIQIYDGGSTAAPHEIYGCETHSGGAGIYVSGTGDLFVTVSGCFLHGWAYWGHWAGHATYPETRVSGFGGGWRYTSWHIAGFWAGSSGGSGSKIDVHHNVVFGVRRGVRIEGITSGDVSIYNNTIVNPFNTSVYDYDGTIDAADIRKRTFGVCIPSGFGGTIANNIIAVTADNRANGDPGSATAPHYTPGITGYGIAFAEGLDVLTSGGTLGEGAHIDNNNVWGFVDADACTPPNCPEWETTASRNWGPGLEDCEDNTAEECTGNGSQDPKFADDFDPEDDEGSPDYHVDRPYERYADNYFLKSTAGSCHANHADVYTSTGWMKPGLGDCDSAPDDDDSPFFDANMGAFGGNAVEEIEADEGGTVTTYDTAVELTIDPGDLGDDETIAITEPATADPDVNILLGSTAEPGEAVAQYIFEPDDLTFDNPVTVTMVKDVTDLLPAQRATLEIYEYVDEPTNAFVPVPGNTCDVVEDPPDTFIATCTAQLDHFSVYAMVAPVNPIPTVSEWGMAVMTLLVLAAGTVVLTRRRRAVTAR